MHDRTAPSRTGLLFEHRVATLYGRLGYEVSFHPPLRYDMTGMSAGQIDLAYWDPNLDRRILIECKYRSNKAHKVGRKDVAYFLDMLDRHNHRPEYAELVTNTAFTPSAVQLAQEHRLRLVSGSLLDRLEGIAREFQDPSDQAMQSTPGHR